jgi:hypothetical protein
MGIKFCKKNEKAKIEIDKNEKMTFLKTQRDGELTEFHNTNE